MRPAAVVVNLPALDLLLRIGQRQEPVYIQALVTETPVERRDEGVIRWLAGPGKVKRLTLVVGPLFQGLRDELAAAIHLGALRDPIVKPQQLHGRDDIAAP